MSEPAKRRIGYVQVVSADMLADGGSEIESVIDRDAESRMRDIAESNGLTLDLPVRKSVSPLVWVDEWNEDGGTFLDLAMARSLGHDAVPTAYQWDYRADVSRP